MFSKRIYMDYAAAAPEIPAARKARRHAERLFGNASSIHKEGVAASRALAEARRAVAATLDAHPDEIIFTATGTESDNLAILGACSHAIESGILPHPHFVTLATEHPAVLERYRHMESLGAEVTYVSVGADGRVDPKHVREALRPETVLVSVMYANNEIGTVQPIPEIAKEIRHFKKTLGRGQAAGSYPYFHTDACQAAHYLDMHADWLGADLVSFSAIKMGGGHGAAALYVRRGTKLTPVQYGGGQEYSLRPGTENLPAIAAFAAACAVVEKEKSREAERLSALRDHFFARIQKKFPEARINGSREHRLPNNVHISFPGMASELLVLELDARGIAASAGSACSASDESESQVLAALYGAGDGKQWGSVRFSLGRGTKKSDIAAALKALASIMKKYSAWKK